MSEVTAAAGTYLAYEPSFVVTVRPYEPVTTERAEGSITISQDGLVVGGFDFAWLVILGDDEVRATAVGDLAPAQLVATGEGLVFDTTMTFTATFTSEGEEPMSQTVIVEVSGVVDPVSGVVSVGAEDEVFEFRR